VKLLCFLLLSVTAFTDDSVPIFKVTKQELQAAPERFYVIAFHMAGCAPCRRWERDEQPKLKAAGLHVERINSQRNTEWGIAVNPTFWICDKTRPNWRMTYTQGQYVSADQLVEQIERLKTEAKPATGTVFNNPSSVSHSSRQSMINHLMTATQHAGRHRIDDLNQMTDQQLSDLHDSDHNEGTNSNAHWTINPPKKTAQVKRRKGFLFFEW